ncbi:MAG: hypothetical protein AAF922_19860 [Pseudomonadota bacterium]
MGPRQVARAVLFYEVALEGFRPAEHPLRGIGRLVDLGGIGALPRARAGPLFV